MKPVEEIIAQKEGVGETTVQGRGKTGEGKGVGETTPLIWVEGTLDKIGEGVARGPMVLKGPQQAILWPWYTSTQAHPREGLHQDYPREGKGDWTSSTECGVQIYTASPHPGKYQRRGNPEVVQEGEETAMILLREIFIF